ncbi:MAG: sulfotransferase family 2 domain-containing protein [Planctomycetes bacterium]|nr:sulfotransferase family 2 domain-containing protein [Planctomycetota bacterium]
MRGERIIVFSHIPKTAGMTVQLLLRRHFGLRHLDLPKGFIYTEALLKRDLRLNPLVRSLAGHSLRPFVDFGALQDRLVWYTFLRDPVQRFISHYQHAVEKEGVQTPFDVWLRAPANSNWHVRMLAGREDLERAKEVLSQTVTCVGLMERFNESLLLIRHSLGIPELKLSYGVPRNTARRSDLRQRIRNECDRHRAEVMERNALDGALYDYAVEVLYPAQVERYGRQRLDEDLERAFSGRVSTVPSAIRYWQSALFRKMFFLPITKVLGRRSGLALDGTPLS